MEELSIVQKIAVMALPLVFAIVFHEVAHGWVANRLGDPTARNAGRLTLNPLSHIDPVGTILMPLLLFFATKGQFVFGYAKPVPIDPSYFKDPRKGMALSAIAGPGVNLFMAALFSLLLRVVLPAAGNMVPESAYERTIFPLALMFGYGVLVNVALAVLNLIPIPPLDGSRIIYWLLPPRQAAAYYRLEPYGVFILMALLITRVLSFVMWPVILSLLLVLLGSDWTRFILHYL